MQPRGGSDASSEKQLEVRSGTERLRTGTPRLVLSAAAASVRGWGMSGQMGLNIAEREVTRAGPGCEDGDSYSEALFCRPSSTSLYRLSLCLKPYLLGVGAWTPPVCFPLTPAPVFVQVHVTVTTLGLRESECAGSGSGALVSVDGARRARAL